MTNQAAPSTNTATSAVQTYHQLVPSVLCVHIAVATTAGMCVVEAILELWPMKLRMQIITHQPEEHQQLFKKMNQMMEIAQLSHSHLHRELYMI